MNYQETRYFNRLPFIELETDLEERDSDGHCRWKRCVHGI